MKVACLDNTARSRLKLQRILEGAFEQTRASLGHVNLAQFYTSSLDELMLKNLPDAVALGPEFGVEDALLVCKDVRSRFPQVPILVVLDTSNYSVRNLRRFQRFTQDVFSCGEDYVRMVYRLTSLKPVNSGKNTDSRLLLVNGAKGGVGATSLVSGLAHAAQSMGIKSLVVDLSAQSSLVTYLDPDRQRSLEMTAWLLHDISPETEQALKAVEEAPNGIHILLPPSGGTDIRDIWLRDAKKFEITLNIIERLKDQYDLILVDLAHTEGILPYALNLRADIRIAVSTNDPASIHLLNSIVSGYLDFMGDADLKILLNMNADRLITKEHVIDFLSDIERFDPSMLDLPNISFDTSGSNWIGTGNSFYTESHKGTQKVLEQIVRQLLVPSGQALPERGIIAMPHQNNRPSVIGRLLQTFRLNSDSSHRSTNPYSSIAALPAPEPRISIPDPNPIKPAEIPITNIDLYEPPKPDTFSVSNYNNYY